MNDRQHISDGFRVLGCSGIGSLLLLLLLPCAAGAEGRDPVSALEVVDWCTDARTGEPLDEAALEARGATIGEVLIVVGDIFDVSRQDEDRKLFRMVNRVHPRTRERVIRRQLLFQSGDPYSVRLLRESERLLRSCRFLYDAEIRPVSCARDVVDVVVETRDVWTLTGGVHFRRSGGENRVQVEIQDYNVLGSGKDITVNRTSSVDRTTSLLRYRDFNLLGSRAELELWMQENSDGDLRLLDLERPFFSLDARWSGGLFALTEDRLDSHYSLGEVNGGFRHRIDRYQAFWGLGRGLEGARSGRWRFGASLERHRFSPGGGAMPPAGIPPDRTLVYPWVGFELAEDGFVEVRDLDRIERTEDLNLGAQLGARLGWSSEALGADREQAIVELAVAKGLRLAPGQLLLASGFASGRWGSSGAEDLRFGVEARYFWRNFGSHLFHAALRFDGASNLDLDEQLLLGGDSGLRGYPLRYQDGDRSVLLTLEQRFFTRWHILRLVHVGAAVFADVGKAWFTGVDHPAELGLLRDVGMGLRLSPSRSGGGTMIHLDVAFPLDGDPSIDDVQWLVTTRDTF